MSLPSPRSTISAGIAALALTLGVVVPPAAGAAPIPAPTGSLAWRACYGSLQCATLSVPLDYSRPDGRRIGIALVRQPASDPGARRGAIVVNPGGPGVSGLGFGQSLAYELPAAVTRQYDVIGFDPRGVGKSEQIHCLGRKGVNAWLKADATPDTEAEVRTFARLSAAFGAACERNSPDLLAHIGTADTARDLDSLRIALGDDRLSFFGASYGTYLGATYARLFPDRVDRMVLDGAVDPSLTQVTLTEGQITGFDDAALRLARHCAESPSCPLGTTSTRGVLTRINAVLESLDRRSLPSRSGGPLTQSEALTALLASLYSDQSWDAILSAFADAATGDGTSLASIGRGFITADPRMLASFLSISCFDSPAPPGPARLARWAQRTARSANVPELARYLAWGVLPCSTWPVHSPRRPGPVSAETAAAVLVVGTEHDPATPAVWARSLARQLSRGVLLRWNGDGHTAYLRGSGCVNRLVNRYLAAGVAPTSGLLCR